ncbi:MAG: hypothetical protein WDN69_34700 [Aliidongia sp.]
MTGVPANGQLMFAVEDEFGRPMAGSLHLLLGETVASRGRQYRINAKPGAAEIGGSFPAGSYTAQLFAAGYGVGRETVRLEPGQSLRCILRLRQRGFVRPSAAERLAVYGLDPGSARPSDRAERRTRRARWQERPHRAACRVAPPGVDLGSQGLDRRPRHGLRRRRAALR